MAHVEEGAKTLLACRKKVFDPCTAALACAGG
jgi:hypothetical protein